LPIKIEKALRVRGVATHAQQGPLKSELVFPLPPALSGGGNFYPKIEISFVSFGSCQIREKCKKIITLVWITSG